MTTPLSSPNHPAALGLAGWVSDRLHFETCFGSSHAIGKQLARATTHFSARGQTVKTEALELKLPTADVLERPGDKGCVAPSEEQHGVTKGENCRQNRGASKTFFLRLYFLVRFDKKGRGNEKVTDTAITCVCGSELVQGRLLFLNSKTVNFVELRPTESPLTMFTPLLHPLP